MKHCSAPLVATTVIGTYAACLLATYATVRWLLDRTFGGQP